MATKYVICEICSQLMEECERIKSVSEAVETGKWNGAELADIYAKIRLDALEHIQVLTLKLTELMTDTENPESEEQSDGEEDGTAFFAGELNDTEEGSKESRKGGEDAKR